MSAQEWILAAVASALAVVGIVVGALSGSTVFAAGLIALATMLVILYQSVQTRRAVDAAKADADASMRMIREVQRDRELGVQPVIVLLNASPNIGNGLPGVQIENVGRGSAIGLRLVQWHSGELFWSGAARTLAPGKSLPSPLEEGDVPLGRHSNWLTLHERRGAASVDASFAQPDPPNDLIAYCVDQLGNGLRFRLGAPEVPTIWRQATEPEPDWATALKEPFDWRPANLRPTLPFERVSRG
jgi:hypothetical protein